MKVLCKNNLRKSQSITVLIISKKKLSLIYYLKKKEGFEEKICCFSMLIY